MIRSIKLSLGEPVPVSPIPMWTLISDGLLCLIWPRARNSSFSALGFWYLRKKKPKRWQFLSGWSEARWNMGRNQPMCHDQELARDIYNSTEDTVMKVWGFVKLLRNQKLIQRFLASKQNRQSWRTPLGSELLSSCTTYWQTVSAERGPAAVSAWLFYSPPSEPRVFTEQQRAPSPPWCCTTPGCGVTHAAAGFTYCDNPWCQCGICSRVVSEVNTFWHDFSQTYEATKRFSVLNTFLICAFPFNSEITFLNATVWGTLDPLTPRERTKPAAAEHDLPEPLFTKLRNLS